MNPSYARVPLPLTAALPRVTKWIRLPVPAPPREVQARAAVHEPCENGDLADDGAKRGLLLLFEERKES